MNDKPIFMQLMEMIEDNIILGVYSFGDLIISSTQMCKLYNVNPVTAMRAITELTNEGILVKDRGIGMRVTEAAKAIIIKKRKELFMDSMLTGFIAEAKKLGLEKSELLSLITKNFD